MKIFDTKKFKVINCPNIGAVVDYAMTYGAHAFARQLHMPGSTKEGRFVLCDDNNVEVCKEFVNELIPMLVDTKFFSCPVHEQTQRVEDSTNWKHKERCARQWQKNSEVKCRVESRNDMRRKAVLLDKAALTFKYAGRILRHPKMWARA